MVKLMIGSWVPARDFIWMRLKHRGQSIIRMESYVTQELYQLILSHFPADQNRVGIFGHSMGGHGALTLAMRNPGLYRSVSAFAPIAAPQHCPWGRKAFSHYLGASSENWCKHDATALIEAGHRLPALLIDQGLSDPFLAEQLQPDRFEAACQLIRATPDNSSP